MLSIALEEVEVRFRRQLLFPPLSWQFESGKTYAITGPNGSGKTTLLRIIAGQKRADGGKISWQKDSKELDPESWYSDLSWSGPYLEYPNELDLQDLLNQHFWFKSPVANLSVNDIPTLLNLKPHLDKKVKLFSSGMLHRLKTGLAVLTQSEVLLLDEPTANMDVENRTRMLDLIQQYKHNRLVIIASNMEEEYSKADAVVRIR
jgi:ABC-type multidrug transport system ATPase subunit